MGLLYYDTYVGVVTGLLPPGHLPLELLPPGFCPLGLLPPLPPRL